MLRAAASLFARQRIQSQQYLLASVPALTEQDADVILPRLAYIFRNGKAQHNAVISLTEAANVRKMRALRLGAERSLAMPSRL